MRIDDAVYGFSIDQLNVANVTLDYYKEAPPEALRKACIENGELEFIGEKWRPVSMSNEFREPMRHTIHLTLALSQPWREETFVENEGRHNERRITKFRRGGKEYARPDWPPPGTFTKGPAK